jgi:hypothetical protein
MLNKNNFEIGKLAPKPDDESRPGLSCVLVSPDKTVVTDGHYIIEVSGAECEDNFLPFDDVMPSADFEPFTVPADEAIALAKVFVKTETPEGNLLAVQPDNGKGVSAFALRQERREKVFRMDKPDRSFPDYEEIFAGLKDEAAFVLLDLNLLIPVLRHMKNVSGGQVRIALNGPDKAVRLDCINTETKQSVRAAIMPMFEKAEGERQ